MIGQSFDLPQKVDPASGSGALVANSTGYVLGTTALKLAVAA